MEQQGLEDDDDDVQEELATQAHPDPDNEDSAPEDEGTPEAELVDDTNLGNTEEEEAASAMDVEPKEELEVQDEVVVEEEKREQDDESTVDPDEKKPSPTDTSTKKQHKEALLPSSILKEPSSDAAEITSTFTKIKEWLRPMSNQVLRRSNSPAASPKATGPVDLSTRTKVAASADAPSAAVTAPATAAVTNATAAAAVSTNKGPSSVEPRKPRPASFPSSVLRIDFMPSVVAPAPASASTPIVPSAEKPERRYKKILSAKSVLVGPSQQAVASRKLSLQLSSSPPTTPPRQASASKRKGSLQSSPPTLAEVAASPTSTTLTTKVRTAAAKRSAEKNKWVSKTPPIPAKKQKTTPASKSSAKSKSPAAATSTSKSKKRANPYEISSGPPDEPMEGGWPAGWRKSVVQRQSGATAGMQDRYWYTPTLGYKLRSMVEVKRFMAALADAKGDEKEAWGVFKHKK